LVTPTTTAERTSSPPSHTTTTTLPISTLAPHPSASELASKLVSVVYPGVGYSRKIPAFTTTTSTLSTLGLIPATVPSFWSRTMFSSAHRVPCILRTVVTLLPGGTISVVPVTRLPTVPSPLSPIPTRWFQPASSSPPSSLMLVPTSPSEHRCIWTSAGTGNRSHGQVHGLNKTRTTCARVLLLYAPFLLPVAPRAFAANV